MANSRYERTWHQAMEPQQHEGRPGAAGIDSVNLILSDAGEIVVDTETYNGQVISTLTASELISSWGNTVTLPSTDIYERFYKAITGKEMPKKEEPVSKLKAFVMNKEGLKTTQSK